MFYIILNCDPRRKQEEASFDIHFYDEYVMLRTDPASLRKRFIGHALKFLLVHSS